MGKINELHLLLDNNVTESDIQAALRLISAEIHRISEGKDRTSPDEILEISRLLLRLTCATSIFKVAIVTGKVFGDLISLFCNVTPEVMNCFHEYGSAVISLIKLNAERGDHCWTSGIIDFHHLNQRTGAIAHLDGRRQLMVSSRRMALSLMSTWASSFSVLVQSKELFGIQTEGIHVMKAIYKLLPHVPIPPRFFCFLSNFITMATEKQIFTEPSDLLDCVKPLLSWIEELLSNHMTELNSASTPQQVLDAKNTASALSNMISKLLSLSAPPVVSAVVPLDHTVGNQISREIQKLLELHIAPNGRLLSSIPYFCKTQGENANRLSCVSIILVSLLSSLKLCISHQGSLNMSIEILFQCCIDPISEREVCDIVLILLNPTHARPDGGILATTKTLLEWFSSFSHRDIGVAITSLKNWLRNSSLVPQLVNRTVEVEENTEAHSYDTVADMKALETLLAWEVDATLNSPAFAAQSSGKKRRLHAQPATTQRNVKRRSEVSGDEGVRLSQGSSNYHLANHLQSLMFEEDHMKEIVGECNLNSTPSDYCGILRFFQKAVIDLLRSSDDIESACLNSDTELSSDMCRFLSQTTLRSGLMLAAFVMLNSRRLSNDSCGVAPSQQLESMSSVVFYLYAVTIEASLNVCRSVSTTYQQSGTSLPPSAETATRDLISLLMNAILDSILRLLSIKGGVSQSSSSSIAICAALVPVDHFFSLLAGVVAAIDEFSEMFAQSSLLSTDPNASSSQPNIQNHAKEPQPPAVDRSAKYKAKERNSTLFYGLSYNLSLKFLPSRETYLELLIVPNLPKTELLSAAFWTNYTSEHPKFVNMRSPFPNLEIFWDRLTWTEKLLSLTLAMNRLVYESNGFDVILNYPKSEDAERVMLNNGSAIRDVVNSDSPQEEDNSSLGPVPLYKTDGLITAFIWICRAAAFVYTNAPNLDHNPPDGGTLSNMYKPLSQLIGVVMKIILSSFPRCAIDTFLMSRKLCPLFPKADNAASIQCSSQDCLFQFQFLDGICTSELPKSAELETVRACEYRRRALISDILPAVGNLWLCAETFMKRDLAVTVANLKSDMPEKMTIDGDAIHHVDFLSQVRAIFGIIRCFHVNRDVHFQPSSVRVVETIDQLIKEYIVASLPSHLLSNAISQTLGVAMIDHGFENIISTPSATENDFLSVMGRMLLHASSKACKIEDEEDYPDGEDVRHTTLRILTPAFASMVKYSAILSPKMSFWAVNQLVSSWVLHSNSWHWAYQIFYEEVYALNRGPEHLLQSLLTSSPKLAAQDFFIPLFKVDSDEITERVFSVVQIEQYLKYYMPHIISTVVITGDLVSFRTLSKRFPELLFLANSSGDNHDCSLSSVLERNPLVLFELLMSDQLQRQEDIHIILNGLPQRLMETIRALKLSNEFNIKSAKPTRGRCLQRYLLHAIWEVGAFELRSSGDSSSQKISSIKSIDSTAGKALKVISALYTTDSWVGGSFEDTSDDNPWTKYTKTTRRNKSTDLIKSRQSALKEFVSDIIPAHFLYIMSHLIQKNWGCQSLHKKEQAVHTVISLMKLVRPDAIAKFLPKAIVAIDTALCSTSARVRFAGVKLTFEICSRLPFDVLCGNVSALVVGLFPIIEGYLAGIEKSEAMPKPDLDEIVADIGACFSHDIDGFQPICHISPKLPKLFGIFAEICFFSSVEDFLSKKAYEMAVDILKLVFLSEGHDNELLFNAVPYIPESCLLLEVKEKHARYLALSSDEHSIRRLCSMLRHESSQVRIVVLRRLRMLIRTHRRLLFSAELSNCNACVTSENTLSTVVGQLLSLCSRETDRTAKELCAACLGELGAVDPARISIRLLQSSVVSSEHLKVIFNREETASSAAGEPLQFSLSHLPPWEFSAWSFGLLLLHEHLIPAVKAANGAGDVAAQDFSGIAIQDLLKILASCLEANETTRHSDKISSKRSGDTISEMSGTQSFASQAIPEPLVNVLQDLQIFDITEPFWNTKYNLPFQARTYVSDLYQSASSFTAWIYNWCLQLMSCGTRLLQPLFKACRGALRVRPELGQFLLPYLILDSVVSSENGKTAAIYETVVKELKGVLSMSATGDDKLMIEQSLASLRLPSENTGQDMRRKSMETVQNVTAVSMPIEDIQLAVQTVFLVMDQYSTWSMQGLADRAKKSRPRSSGKDGVAFDFERYNSVFSRLFNDIPMILLGRAALGIKAYARSARYFEISARDEYRHTRRSNSKLLSGEDADTTCAPSTFSSEAPASKMMAPPNSKVARNPTNGLDSDGTSINSSNTKRRSRDGANGELPVLSKEILDNLLSIYARLDDNDSLYGVQNLRHLHEITPSPWNRIVEMEQLELWLDALREYDLLQLISIPAETAGGYGLGDAVETMVVENNTLDTDDTYMSAPDSNDNENSETFPEDISMSQQIVESSLNISNRNEEHYANDRGAGGGSGWQHHQSAAIIDNKVSNDHKFLSFVERGKLRCLIEMGHTKLALDEFKGVSMRLPTLSQDIYALGIEATWQLGEWGKLEEMLLNPPNHASNNIGVVVHSSTRGNRSSDDEFLVSSGKLLMSLLHCQKQQFTTLLSETRLQIMSFLSAASMESYSRCYPALVQLHVLQELEHGFEINQSVSSEAEISSRLQVQTEQSLLVRSDKERQIRDQFDWDQRFSMISPSFKQRSKVLASRRAVLGILNIPNLVAESWLSSCRALRQMGRFDAAMIALRHAEAFGLGHEQVLLEECYLIKETGNIRKALMLLEPDEGMLNKLRIFSNVSSTSSSQAKKAGGNSNAHSAPLVTADEARALSNRLLIATRWMIDSKLVAHAREIFDRFKIILNLNKDWEDAYFYLAKYNDDLYESKLKEMKQKGQVLGDDEKHVLNFAVTALDSYGKAIKVGSKFIMRAMPKFLSVYFSFMALRGGSAHRTSDPAKSFLAQAQRAMASRALKYSAEIPACKWYTCMPQIVSRVGHQSPDALKLVKNLVSSILVEFPEQSIWHVSSLLHSMNKERSSVGHALIKDAVLQLEKKRRFVSSQMLVESILLFKSLVELAQNQPKDRRIRWSIGTECQLSAFLVPSQSALTMVFPPTESQLLASSGGSAYFPSDQVYFQSFDHTVEVMMTKAKPKKISAMTSCGKSVRFLLKQERFGDLRKDARLMEFNTIVNRLLQEEPECRKRNLRLRTFCVVCLNEECGIMEWVPNTVGLRSLIVEGHSRHLDEYPYVDIRSVKDDIEEMQNKFVESNLEELLSAYKQCILNRYRPCFHMWFLERFRDPTEWLEARDRFSRSSAVWSAVGHIVGLGDRHGDNILLDVTIGECVHVDFDCLFDKGLKLQRPEIVPFRLTPSMVDAMGILGYEGSYRRTMEVCLSLLRSHRDTLIGVLEPFIRDPTVAWGRGGRAQQRYDSMGASALATGGANRSAVSAAGTVGPSNGFKDTENKDAEDALTSISDRLHGIYNISHPKATKISNAYRSQGRALPKIGLGASHEEGLNLPLSVDGQVDRLILEATAEINLAQMYHGWMPWS